MPSSRKRAQAHPVGVLCRAYASGQGCDWGASCKFEHDLHAPAAPDIGGICWDFSAHGSCLRETQNGHCGYVHERTQGLFSVDADGDPIWAPLPSNTTSSGPRTTSRANSSSEVTRTRGRAAALSVEHRLGQAQLKEERILAPETLQDHLERPRLKAERILAAARESTRAWNCRAVLAEQAELAERLGGAVLEPAGYAFRSSSRTYAASSVTAVAISSTLPARAAGAHPVAVVTQASSLNWQPPTPSARASSTNASRARSCRHGRWADGQTDCFDCDCERLREADGIEDESSGGGWAWLGAVATMAFVAYRWCKR